MTESESDLIAKYFNLLQSGIGMSQAKLALGIYHRKWQKTISRQALARIHEISENYRIAKHLRKAP